METSGKDIVEDWKDHNDPFENFLNKVGKGSLVTIGACSLWDTVHSLEAVKKSAIISLNILEKTLTYTQTIRSLEGLI